MKLLIVGQKWLAATLLQRLPPFYTVTVVAPNKDDKLYKTAQAMGVATIVITGELNARYVDPDTDLIVCAHAHCYVSPEAISKAKFGAIGYHPSLLPLHRGRDAVHWAVHMRERVTGGTVYWLDQGADTGLIEIQDWCLIRPDDTPATLWRRDLAPMGLRLLLITLKRVLDGSSTPAPQTEQCATWEPALKMRRLSG